MIELFQAIGLGLVVILPLANPLTTVALFLGLAGNMNNEERNKQSLMASVYVFIILMVARYAGQVVMSTFGISIPGLRIAGGLIVAFIGFRMLFPQQKSHDSMEAKIKSEELVDEPTANIAFVPLAMPSTAGPGTIAMLISTASTVKHGVDFPDWVVLTAPPIIFARSGLSSGAVCAVPGQSCVWWGKGNRSDFAPDGLSAGLHGRTVYYQRRAGNHYSLPRLITPRRLTGDPRIKKPADGTTGRLFFRHPFRSGEADDRPATPASGEIS